LKCGGKEAKGSAIGFYSRDSRALCGPHLKKDNLKVGDISLGKSEEIQQNRRRGKRFKGKKRKNFPRTVHYQIVKLANGLGGKRKGDS